ncbi:MAG TPA: choice-of-anchor Q domain-containing protein [Blastocatellia bacterium]
MRIGLTKYKPFARVGIILVSLIAASISNRPGSAATNRFVSPSGNDNGGANTCAEPNSPCKTIQNAVNHSASGDTIELAGGTYVENVTIAGDQNNPPTLTIQGNPAAPSIVNGNKANSVFTIGNVNDSQTDANVTFNMLTITNGNAANQSGVSAGGGIFAETANITLSRCTVSGNQSTASLGFGGGIAGASGTVTVINSTIAGNSASSLGAAIFAGFGVLTVVNSTISGNSVEGIVSLGTLNLTNTIVAGNPIADIDFDIVGTNDHNFVGDGSLGGTLTGNPMLGPLQNNGGPTATMALLTGSRAIDAGDDSVLGPPFDLTTDQRGVGFARKSGAHVDIGAYESAYLCLKDNTTGNLLQWDTTTGSYIFTRCSDGFTVSGTGTVGLVNGIHTLTASTSTARVSAGLNSGQQTGGATIYLMVAQGVWETFRINDTNPAAVCACTG